MTFRYFILGSLILLAGVACRKEESPESAPVLPEGSDRITASLEQASLPDSRTGLSSGSVLWSAGDAIKVYTGEKPEGSPFYLDDSSAGKSSGTFTGTLSGTAPYCAVYPASAGVRLEDGSLILSLPSTQTYVSGGFASGSNPSVAWSSNPGTLDFKNLCGLVVLRLKGSVKVSQIRITSNAAEPLWGEASVSMDYTDAPVLDFSSDGDESHRTLTLSCASPVQLNTTTATPFYFVVPAGALASGFKVSLYDNASGGMTKSAPASSLNKVVRSSVLTMPEFVFSVSTLPNITTLTSVGSTFSWNFNEPTILQYKGAKAGDKITFTSRADASKTYTAYVTSSDGVEGTAFTAIPGFIGGMYKVSLTVNGSTWTPGTTFINVIDTHAVPQKTGYTMYGRVVDNSGNPIRGVSVSDGVRTVKTDASGQYYINSARKYGYVMISQPQGYMVAVNRSTPQFFRRVGSDKSVFEMNNFVVEPFNAETHRAIVFTDCHLANRTSDDVQQFRAGFKAELGSEQTAAQSSGRPLIALCLGDSSWDQFWYSNLYTPWTYKDELAGFDIPILVIPGNHDNDPYIADDFSAEDAFRDAFGPCYYSFNYGKVHYIMMDDSVFGNKGASQGVIGDLSVTCKFTTDELQWLKADLQNAPSDCRIVVGVHCQFTTRPYLPDDTHSDVWYNYNMPQSDLSAILNYAGSRQVEIVSGHTHCRYTNYFSDTAREQNVGAICATWWWTGKYTNYYTNISTDGTPAGYLVMDNTASSVKSVYKPVGKDWSYQFRAYDLNNCQITKSEYAPKTKYTDAEFAEYTHGFEKARSDNKVLINVFNWNIKYNIKVTEVQTGKVLPVTRVDNYDPLHIVHFNMQRVNNNKRDFSFETGKTGHFFECTCSNASNSVKIEVTDENGTTYTETMARPRKLSTMKNETKW